MGTLTESDLLIIVLTSMVSSLVTLLLKDALNMALTAWSYRHTVKLYERIRNMPPHPRISPRNAESTHLIGDHPSLIRMTRQAWQELDLPYKQSGGRYWPNGTPELEYTFHYDDEDTYHLPWPEQTIWFQRVSK